MQSEDEERDRVDYRPNRHGAVAVILREGRFLVIRRSQRVVAPGMYCFPGGGIESEESEPQALVREIREELGVVVQPIRCVWRSVTPWKVRLAWWLSRLEPAVQLTPDQLEVESVHWFTPNEMAKLPDLLASNHHFLEALRSGRIDLRE
jgi:8-oxo-dGTP diphosphatase